MSNQTNKLSYILGGDSVTVFVDGKSYTINRESQTFPLVMQGIKNDSIDAVRNAVNIRKSIETGLQAKGKGKVVIDNDKLYYDGHEITGLVASRIFEILNLGLDVQPMVNFLENLMQNPSHRAVSELFGFLDACNLPITPDGHFLAYKRVRSDYTDVHSGRFDNSVGKILSMPRNMVDEDKNRTCSAGLHFCSYDYLSQFGGERIMVLKINPADVVAIPADYNNSKGRTCRYEVVDELPVNEYRMPVNKIKADYTDQYADEYIYDDSEYDDDDDGEELLTAREVEEIVRAAETGSVSIVKLALNYGVDTDDIMDVLRQNNVVYGSKKAKAATTNGSLSEATVKAIRRALSKGCSLAEIARTHSVSARTVGRIRDGETYTFVV